MRHAVQPVPVSVSLHASAEKPKVPLAGVQSSEGFASLLNAAEVEEPESAPRVHCEATRKKKPPPQDPQAAAVEIQAESRPLPRKPAPEAGEERNALRPEGAASPSASAGRREMSPPEAMSAALADTWGNIRQALALFGAEGSIPSGLDASGALSDWTASLELLSQAVAFMERPLDVSLSPGLSGDLLAQLRASIAQLQAALQALAQAQGAGAALDSLPADSLVFVQRRLTVIEQSTLRLALVVTSEKGRAGLKSDDGVLAPPISEGNPGVFFPREKQKAEAAQFSALLLPHARQPSETALKILAQPVEAQLVAQAGLADGKDKGQTGTGAHDDGQAQPMMPAAAPASAPAIPSSQPVFARILSQTLHVPVAEQVAVHVKTALKDGSSHIRIQLDPQDLGKLDIRLDISAGGKTGVMILADNRQTLDLLQRDARALQQALQDAGLQAGGENLSFNLRDGRQQQEEEQPQRRQAAYPQAWEEEAAPAAILRHYVVNLSEGLDIKI